MLSFNTHGVLIPGVHTLDWNYFITSYSFSNQRKKLFKGMQRAFIHFKNAGCKIIYVDGSFVTKKIIPNDYDACWDMNGVDYNILHPMFHRDLKMGTGIHKLTFGGEFYPASHIEGGSGLSFLDFFQTDKMTGRRKGIIKIKLEEVK